MNIYRKKRTIEKVKGKAFAFVKGQEGLTMLEWAALAVVLILAAWGVMSALGESVGNVFEDLRGKLGH